MCRLSVRWPLTSWLGHSWVTVWQLNTSSYTLYPQCEQRASTITYTYPVVFQYWPKNQRMCSKYVHSMNRQSTQIKLSCWYFVQIFAQSIFWLSWVCAKLCVHLLFLCMQVWSDWCSCTRQVCCEPHQLPPLPSGLTPHCTGDHSYQGDVSTRQCSTR